MNLLPIPPRVYAGLRPISRGPDKLAHFFRDSLGMFSHALDDAINGCVALKVRLDWVIFVFDEEM